MTGSQQRIMEDRKSIKFVGTTRATDQCNYLISPIIFGRVHFSCHYRDAVSLYDFPSAQRPPRHPRHCYEVISLGATIEPSCTALKSDFLSACLASRQTDAFVRFIFIGTRQNFSAMAPHRGGGVARGPGGGGFSFMFLRTIRDYGLVDLG